jgi:hypothetical protein
VIYLGSAVVADLGTDCDIVAINRKGEIEDNQRAILKDIEGIVLLDGTWSQVAQRLDAEMPARHPRAGYSLALWQTAPRAAPRRTVYQRGGGDDARKPRKAAE